MVQEVVGCWGTPSRLVEILGLELSGNKAPPRRKPIGFQDQQHGSLGKVAQNGALP